MTLKEKNKKLTEDLNKLLVIVIGLKNGTLKIEDVDVKTGGHSLKIEDVE